MVAVVKGPASLEQMFAALTEQTFQVDFGLADPQLTDYLAGLLLRFIRTETIFKFRNPEGERLAGVVDMLVEAGQRAGKPQREIYRHIGDFTLFWTGVYPETLLRLQSPDTKDHLIDYCAQGKRCYYIASTFDDEPYREEAPILRRLSVEFDLCSEGLRHIRREWEKADATP